MINIAAVAVGRTFWLAGGDNAAKRDFRLGQTKIGVSGEIDDDGNALSFSWHDGKDADQWTST